MPDNQNSPSRLRDHYYAITTRTREHPGLALLWVATFVLLILSFVDDSEHLGRASLWLTLVALAFTTGVVARWVVQRFVRITSVFVEDVDAPQRRHPNNVSSLPPPREDGGKRRRHNGA